MAKLNPNAQKWVDALRSGKYQQGKHRLRTGSTFCCLGVACDVFKKELNLRWRKRDYHDGDKAFTIGGQDAQLPLVVQSHLGLKTANGAIPNIDTLAGYNDYRASTLSEIADLIEANAEELGLAAHA